MEERLTELENFVKSLKLSSTIPLDITQAFRKRFNVPIVVIRRLDFANTSAQLSSTVTTDINGAQVGDLVVVTPPVSSIIGNLGGIFTAYVNTTNSVTIKFFNPDTGTALNPPEGDYTIGIFKPE